MGLISMILPSIGVSSLYLQHNRLPLIWTSMISALSLALYSDDKEQALTGGRRVKENWLLIVDLLGGWPGGFVGQWWCRHKVRKTSYQFCYWVVVLLHNLVWASVLWRMLHGAYINIVSQSQKRGWHRHQIQKILQYLHVKSQRIIYFLRRGQYTQLSVRIAVTSIKSSQKVVLFLATWLLDHGWYRAILTTATITKDGKHRDHTTISMFMSPWSFIESMLWYLVRCSRLTVEYFMFMPGTPGLTWICVDKISQMPWLVRLLSRFLGYSLPSQAVGTIQVGSSMMRSLI